MGSDETARIEITASSSRLAGALNEAFKKITEFSTKSEKKVSGIGKAFKATGLGDAGKHALGYIGGNIAMRGLDAFHEGAEHVLEFEKALSRLQISSMQNTAQIDGMRRAARQLGRDTAFDPSVVVEGAQAFVDLAGASAYSAETMGTIARTAKATNSPIQDIVTMVYTLKDALKIDPKEFESVMSGLHEQSKEGSVHFNKMAGEFIALAPKFARFGVVGRQGAMELGAMFQIVRSGVKGPEEVSTGLGAMFRGVILHADKFKKAGVNVFNVDGRGVKTLRTFQEIMHDIMNSSLAKDPQKLVKAFGRGDGENTFRLLVDHASKYARLMELSADTESVQHDLMQYLASDAGRIEKAMNEAKISTQEAFTPERIKKFADILERVADRAGDLADKVGVITDLLGGIEGVGESVRAVFDPNTNQNPFVEQWNNSRYQLERASTMQDEEGVKRQSAAMERAVANSHAYNDAAKGIMGGERDDKTTPESIRRAVLLKHGDLSQPGQLGFWSAADKYLSNAKVSPEEQAKIFAEAQKEAFAPFIEMLAKALPGLNPPAPEVKMDAQKVGVVAKARNTTPRRKH